MLDGVVDDPSPAESSSHNGMYPKPPNTAPPRSGFIRSRGKVVQQTCADLERRSPGRCIDCGTLFADAAVAFCLACGEPRVDALLNELFDMFTMSHTTMRHAMLPKLHKEVEQLRQKMPHMKEKSTRKQLMDTNTAYNETLTLRMDSGCKYNQGVTREFFAVFLKLVAKSLDVTFYSFLIGMANQQASQETSFTWSSSFQAQRSTKHMSCHCGGDMVTASTNCCCSCGQKQLRQEKKNSDSRLAFSRVGDTLSGAGGAAVKMGTKEWVELMRLSQAHHIPFSEAQKFWNDFQDYDRNKDKILQRNEFEAAVRDRCNLPQDTEVSNTLFMDQWFKTSPQGDEFVDLEAFLIWSIGTDCMEERAVPDPKERRLRHLASEFKLSSHKLDRIKATFDKFDVDNKGVLDERGFIHTVLHILDSQSHEAFCESIVKRWWKEVNFKAEGSVDFETFLAWYLQRWAPATRVH